MEENLSLTILMFLVLQKRLYLYKIIWHKIGVFHATKLTNQITCANAMQARAHALMVQNNTMSFQYPGQENKEEQDTPDMALMNWQGEEFCGVNHPQTQNQSNTPIAANTRQNEVEDL